MKIIFANQNNNLNQVNYQKKNQEISFEAGLTPKMMQEILRADVLEISSELAKKGIPTDFKENKVIAWCSEKTVDIFQQLNEKYKLKLALPKGIYVDDFENLNTVSPDATGYCNLFPTHKFKKNSNELVQGETVFFNTFETLKSKLPVQSHSLYDWTNINEIADFNYATKYSSTDHFLDFFLHEFSHVSHEDRLLHKMGGKPLFKSIELVQDAEQVEKYQKKYGTRISPICTYALLTNPLEAVACDMSSIIAKSLDGKTLMPTKNPFSGTPYEKLSLWKRINVKYYTDEQRPLNEILRNFWNGKFE